MSSEIRLEIEVKIKVSTLSSWRDKLLSLGAREHFPRMLEQNLVLDTPGRSLRGQGILLRLRRAGGKNILTMKTPAEGNSLYKVRNETEIEVADFARMEKILRGIGFQPVFIYEKYREVLSLDRVQVMLDETPIGCFLEIEGETAAIDDAAARLGFSRSAYIRDSYYRLFLDSGGSGDMVFSK